MPARLVFDYSHGQTRSGLLRILRLFLGSILVAAGLLATIVAMPTGFITVADIVFFFNPQERPPFEPGFPLRELEVAFAVALFVAIVGLRHGRRLIRGRRRVVLFLRRFGFQGSMQAVSFAVVHTIGMSWRLVTLDDAAIAPVGVATVSRMFFGVGGWIARAVSAAGRGVFVAFQWACGGMWLIVAIQALAIWLSGDWRRALADGTVDRYARIFSRIMEGRVPVGYFAPTLPGLFAIFATGLALSLIGLLVVMVVLLLTFPLFGVLILATSSAEALRKAEASKTQSIASGSEISETVERLAEQGRQTFAPRLVVLRVATPVWQQTVISLTGIAAASVIDISDPSEHLLWELDELERLAPGRWIAIGEQDRVEKWAASVADAPDTFNARFAQRLGSRPILAYTTDRRGMRRFARALLGMLLDIEDGV